MSSPRGTKRSLSDGPAKEEVVPEEEGDEEGSSSGESDEEKPFSEGPSADVFSPSKEARVKRALPQRAPYIDRPFIVAGSLLETAKLMQLPHARAGKAQYFVQTGAILEIQRVRRDPGSWFAGDAVIEDGSHYIATAVDPLFLILPLLENCRKKSDTREGYFIPLQQMFGEDERFASGFQYAFELGLFNNVHMLCDIRTVGDEKLYRLSDERVLAWLEAKMVALTARLTTMDATICQSSAMAANVNLAHQNVSEVEATKVAVGLLSEYVSAEWIRRVCTSMNIPEPSATKPPSAYLAIEPKSYRRAAEKDVVAKPKAPAAIRRLESVDKRGMASIMSFFKPKPKPPS